MSEIPNKKDIILYFHIMETAIIVPICEEQSYDCNAECDEFFNALFADKYCATCEGMHHYSQCPGLKEKSRNGKLLMMCLGSIIQGMMMRAIQNHYCDEVSLDDFVEFSDDLQLKDIQCWGCHREYVFQYKSFQFRIDMPPRDHYDDCVFEEKQSSLMDAVKIEREFILHAFEHARP